MAVDAQDQVEGCPGGRARASHGFPTEVIYEDLHFVAVVLTFLTAVGSVLAGLLWVCNRCGRLWKQRLLAGEAWA